jgi:hypothetical protein
MMLKIIYYIGISSSSQQSSVTIRHTGIRVSPYRWSRISPALPSYAPLCYDNDNNLAGSFSKKS